MSKFKVGDHIIHNYYPDKFDKRVITQVFKKSIFYDCYKNGTIVETNSSTMWENFQLDYKRQNFKTVKEYLELSDEN